MGAALNDQSSAARHTAGGGGGGGGGGGTDVIVKSLSDGDGVNCGSTEASST